MTPTNEALLACPFCGHHAKLIESAESPGKYGSPAWKVACDFPFRPCFGGFINLWMQTPEEAIAAWNARPAARPQDGAAVPRTELAMAVHYLRDYQHGSLRAYSAEGAGDLADAIANFLAQPAQPPEDAYTIAKALREFAQAGGHGYLPEALIAWAEQLEAGEGRAVTAQQPGEVVWQWRQAAYPFAWLDAENEADARSFGSGGYEVRCLYTAPPPQQAEQGQACSWPSCRCALDLSCSDLTSQQREGGKVRELVKNWRARAAAARLLAERIENGRENLDSSERPILAEKYRDAAKENDERADELESALAQPQPQLSAWVSTMHASNGTEYWVCVGRGKNHGEYMTVRKSHLRNRSEYEAAEWNHLFGLRDKPDLMEYPDPDDAAPPESSEPPANYRKPTDSDGIGSSGQQPGEVAVTDEMVGRAALAMAEKDGERHSHSWYLALTRHTLEAALTTGGRNG